MARVALVFGGRSVEHKVSVISARTVAAALAEAGHEVVPFGVGLSGVWLDPEASTPALAGEVDVVTAADGPVPPSLRPFLESGVDVAFPVVHGTWGEDGTLQGLFEMLDLPYVGAGVTASAVAMDKVLCKRVLEGAGVPVVEYRAARRAELEADAERVMAHLAELEAPVFVKPSVGGSSVGIRRVAASEDLWSAVTFAFRFDDQVLVETEIVGRELECSVLGYPRLEASAIGEIVPGAEFYDYADKYLDDNAGLHVPADLEPEIAAEVQRAARCAFGAIGGVGMARVDFLLRDDGEMFVNEINTLPGFTSISMYPKLWEVSGLAPAALVDRLVQEGIARHGDRRRLDQGIKDWVAELERG